MITEDQRKLLDGKQHYWARPYPPADIVIFGVCYDLDDYYAENLAVLGKDGADYENRIMRDALTRGLIYGKCYSVMEPEGEIGSTPVTEVFEIPEIVFDFARQTRWTLGVSRAGDIP